MLWLPFFGEGIIVLTQPIILCLCQKKKLLHRKRKKTGIRSCRGHTIGIGGWRGGLKNKYLYVYYDSVVKDSDFVALSCGTLVVVLITMCHNST